MRAIFDHEKLDVLVAIAAIDSATADEGKKMLQRVVGMLTRLAPPTRAGHSRTRTRNENEYEGKGELA